MSLKKETFRLVWFPCYEIRDILSNLLSIAKFILISQSSSVFANILRSFSLLLNSNPNNLNSSSVNNGTCSYEGLPPASSNF